MNFVTATSGVDKSNKDIDAVFYLWKTYLSANPDSARQNPLWSSSANNSSQRFIGTDLVNTTYNALFGVTLYSQMYHAYRATVLSITKQRALNNLNNDVYVIKTLFGLANCSGFTLPLCITEVAAVREGKDFRLANILPYNTARWQKHTMGTLTFVTSPDRTFNEQAARRTQRFWDSLASSLRLPSTPVEYYLTDSHDNIMKMIGFDHYNGAGNVQSPRGFVDARNALVYGGGVGEWAPQEFAFLAASRAFPKAHYYFLKGYAALSIPEGAQAQKNSEKTLYWQMRRTSEYLRTHPALTDNVLAVQQIDTSGEGESAMNDVMDATGVWGGIVCRAAQQKGGAEAVRALFTFSDTDEGFFQALETVLGIKRTNVNDWLRARLAEYAR